VFSLPEESLPVPKPPSTTQLTVGLGLINYYGWGYDSINGERIYQEYLTKIKCFVAWLLDRGFTVRIISGDDVDQRPVADIIDFVIQEKPSWRPGLIVEKIPNVSELFSQIAQADIVVASRFHNVLCSLMLGRPVISLGYHAKNDALMAEMGLETYCQHIETFTFERLVEQFEAYLSNLDQATQRIHQQQQKYRRLLDEQYRNVLLAGGNK
jgi:polysaccharide pyruvyl transferase WcaK-like protein